MKTKFYLYTFAIGALLTFFDSQGVKAQCTCTGGVPATPVQYSFTLSPTSLPSATVSFPKFDAAIGDLNCVRFNYDVSGVSTTGARNLAASTSLLPTFNPNYSPTGRLEYIFQLTVAATISGPGVSVVRPYNEIYGPDSLGAYGTIDDTITYGPDQIFQNDIGVRNTTNTAPYLGTGNVNFSYSISGGLSTLKGGLNYSQKIVTEYEGDFVLTYYWCPFSPLPTKIFKTTLQNNKVLVQWQADHPSSASVYEVQVSTDGKNFTTVHVQGGQNGGSYDINDYVYSIGQTNNEKIFFRIKEIGAEGKTSYSKINTVSLKDITPYSNLGIYPNPAINKVVLQFDQEMDGEFGVDIVNLMGQRVFHRKIQINRSNVANLDLQTPPSRGMYYLRATDRITGQVYINKVFIK